jgi:hypothetical protein
MPGQGNALCSARHGGGRFQWFFLKAVVPVKAGGQTGATPRVVPPQM